MKFSQGDSVVVTAGKDKGKKGTVLRVLREENRLIVGGVNMVTKHVKKTAQSEGRKLVLEHSISASNVMIADPKTGKPTRIGYKKDEKGRKVRFAKKSGATLERSRIEADKKDGKGAVAATKDGTPAKSKFWNKVGFSAEPDAQGGKTEAGPAKGAPTVTRSGGRGS